MTLLPLSMIISPPVRSFRRAIGVTAAVLLAGLPISHLFGQVQVAGELLISLDASTFSNGASDWLNSGTLGGSFSSNGTPIRETSTGAASIFLDGNDYFVGPATNALLHDANKPYTIETWVNNGHLHGEETLVSWSARGNDGTNVSQNFGNNNAFGAMGHWGGTDMGFGPTDGVNGSLTPSSGSWHHLVYTYDGAGTQKVFVDGVNTNTESGVFLDAKDNFSINIGTQRTPEGTIDGANRLTGEISKVRIHSGALSATQVTSNYNLEKTQFTPVVKTLTRGPVHRYTFNSLSGAGDGAVVPDIGSAANANATIRGAGAALTANGKGIDLPGGSPVTQAYIDLPNGVASGKFNGGLGYASASYETWVTIQSNQNWSRIIDFGTGTEGEKLDPGGTQNGTDYVFLSANTGGDPTVRLERSGASAGVRDTENNNRIGSEMHLLMTYDASLQEWKWYQNGSLVEGFSSTGSPDTLNDVNNWLGRSQWNGDANVDGVYNEFRIYDYALTQEQAAGNFAAGPDVVNVPEPGTIATLLTGIGFLGLRRRRA
ncbi:MAG: hypothetical protein JWL59_4568 [Chthoniobacteraceae bacterium]|nr:hypothetical protein [Chthoniobacteraceae bacterium]